MKSVPIRSVFYRIPTQYAIWIDTDLGQMRENKGRKNFKYGHIYRNVKFFNFTVFTMGFILDVGRALGLAKLIFV